VTRAGLPRYTERHGWRGGNCRALYAFVPTLAGSIVVRPGDDFRGIGPTCTVRLATHAEALAHWQNPLHAGWIVADDPKEVTT